MKLYFQVRGHNPLPKQSYRATKGGGYTPARIKAWQDTVAWHARQAYSGEPTDKKLHVMLFFIRSDRRRVDLDNLSKAVLDAMNGIVYLDDKQVVHLTLIKRFTTDKEIAGVNVLVMEADDENPV